ncbi:response regulator [Bradyrhizobium sp.]|uniref:response regulator n=1 Tax=Bradyrhizobium sp. TaxID=376 RepID=UPI001ED2EAF3|nr:response regulator [Bradyrhizobium sp.]MBV8916599.1 response regulator [Bradyrhizobium sp.]MBV9979417.1 response regulator [Bradyrhizobium sp.]
MAHTVLLVDDDPTLLFLTAEMLKNLGCDVVTAANGREALDLLRRNREIRILLTDVNMPGMDGYELAQKALDVRRDLRVLLLSGREPDGHGFPLIRKPFLEQDLRRVMEQTTGAC